MPVTLWCVGAGDASVGVRVASADPAAHDHWVADGLGASRLGDRRYLIGATLVVGADLAARTIRPPAELPLGAVTAVLGGPFFLIQLRRAR